MDEFHESTQAAVDYKCSWLRRLYAMIVVGLLILLVGLMSSGLLWIAIPAWLWGANATLPGWWHIAATAGLLCILLLTMRWISRAIPSRILLKDDVIEIGGILFRRRIPYDRVRVVQLHKREGTLDRSLELRIIRFRGRQVSIDLGRDDAHECFHALHQVSDATAIDVDDSVYAPVNPALENQGRTDAARVFLRRARGSWIAAALVGAYSIFVIFALLFWSPSNQPRAWRWAVIGPLVTTLAIGNALRNRSLAANILSASSDAHMTVDEASARLGQ